MVLMNYSMILYRAQNIFEVEPNFMANFMNKELRIDGFIKHLGVGPDYTCLFTVILIYRQ